MSSSDRPSLEDAIALGGFVDTQSILLILVPDPENLDKHGNPMYMIIFMPPKTKLQVVGRRSNELKIKVLGCDWPMGEEDQLRLRDKIMPQECITGFIDLQAAL